MPDRTRRLALAACVVALLALTPAVATAQVTEPLDRAEQATIIEGVCSALDETYVFADVATAMGERVRARLTEGAYDELTTLPAFCGRLTEDLRSVSHDLHLAVRWAPPPPEPEGERPSDEERQRRFREQMERVNYCFERAEVLPGNVGYLKLDCFAEAEWGGDTAVAAMRFLNRADALIFDLRDNGGGNPSMIQLISSYLFEEPVHLNSFYIRKTDETKQFWTPAHVDGERMPDVPVYVLTSSRTFSGAEEFSYNLKNLERATLVGETTGGGAHPVERREIGDTGVVMALPYGRAVNPITGGNWEGTGVEPHIKVPAKEALTRAHLEAIQELAERAEDDADRGRLEWVRQGLEAELNPVELAPEQLEAYAGTYGPRTVTVIDGVLRYRRGDGPAHELVPMGEDLFMLPAVGYFRVHFQRDDAGRVVRLVGLYDNGTSDAHERDGS